MSFLGLNIAKTGIDAARRRLETTGHNIANANTPGYSRQEVISSARKVTYVPTIRGSVEQGIQGQGVEILDVRRVRNDFFDNEFRKHNEDLGYYDKMRSGLSQVELLFNEPSDSSFSSTMNSFWNSFSELSKAPDSLAARNALIESSIGLTSSFNNIGNQLDALKENYDKELTHVVNEVNSLSKEIYVINEEIKKIEVTGNTANDLRDKRDSLIDDLSKIVNIDSYEDSSGGVSILVGGKLLVGINTQKQLDVKFDPATQTNTVVWKDEDQPANIQSGELKAIIDMKTKVVDDTINKLNTLMFNMSEQINTQHKAGYALNGTPGLDFFVSKNGDPINISNVAVNPLIVDNEGLVAASSDSVYMGDNENIKKILGLRENKSLALSMGVNVSFDDYYGYMISGIGVQSRQMDRLYGAKDNSIKMVESKRDEVSGVSLDEEMSNLVSFQHTYNACAKVMTTMDEMLDTLINM